MEKQYSGVRVVRYRFVGDNNNDHITLIINESDNEFKNLLLTHGLVKRYGTLSIDDLLSIIGKQFGEILKKNKGRTCIKKDYHPLKDKLEKLVLSKYVVTCQSKGRMTIV